MSYKFDQPLTKARIMKIIKKHFPNQKVTIVNEITDSFVNPVYSFSLDNELSFILKFSNPRWPLKQQREIESITKAKLHTSIPIPNLVAFSSNDDSFTYMIQERATGVDLRKLILMKQLTSNEILSIIKKISFHLAELHSIKFDFYGDFSSLPYAVTPHTSYLWGKRFQSWQECFQAYCLDILNWVDRVSFQDYRKKLIEKIIAYSKIVPEPSTACFLHSDIQPSNIIVNNKEISAIIDFEWSFAGSASFDLFMAQAGFYFSLFPTLSLSKLYSEYPQLNHKAISQAFFQGYSSSESFSSDAYPADFQHFLWLLFIIGSWKWSLELFDLSTIAQLEKDIHTTFSHLIF